LVHDKRLCESSLDISVVVRVCLLHLAQSDSNLVKYVVVLHPCRNGSMFDCATIFLSMLEECSYFYNHLVMASTVLFHSCSDVTLGTILGETDALKCVIG